VKRDKDGKLTGIVPLLNRMPWDQQRWLSFLTPRITFMPQRNYEYMSGRGAIAASSLDNMGFLGPYLQENPVASLSRAAYNDIKVALALLRDELASPYYQAFTTLFDMLQEQARAAAYPTLTVAAIPAVAAAIARAPVTLATNDNNPMGTAINQNVHLLFRPNGNEHSAMGTAQLQSGHTEHISMYAKDVAVPGVKDPLTINADVAMFPWLYCMGKGLYRTTLNETRARGLGWPSYAHYRAQVQFISVFTLSMPWMLNALQLKIKHLLQKPQYHCQEQRLTTLTSAGQMQ
jgi:hypothetical protein